MIFEKWEACGNDFIVTELEDLKPEEARDLCDRHYGVGADGVLVVGYSEIADAKMTVFNADGSIAEMCGNGLRCVGQYVWKRKRKRYMEIETGAGVKPVEMGVENERISVGMGKAVIQWTHELEFETGNHQKRRYENATYVDIGNPHCVLLVEEKATKFGAVERFGRKIEQLTEVFAEGTNVEFVTLEGADKLRVRVWERGCGRTLACGTGACASAYALYKQELVSNIVKVRLDGGEVEVRLSDNMIELIGPARRVFVAEKDMPGGLFR